jgi:hypothetical protein
MPIIINMEGTPPLRGVPYPTFKCGQNVKIKNRVDFDFAPRRGASLGSGG